MEQILEKKMATRYHNDREYRPHMLPKTDDILERAVNISIGVVDKGLGAGFGINIHSDPDEISAVANNINKLLEYITSV